MKEKIILGLEWIVLTNIGRILLAFIMGNIFLAINNHTNNELVSTISFYGIWLMFGFIGLFTVVAIVFAWIINPFKTNKNK